MNTQATSYCVTTGHKCRTSDLMHYALKEHFLALAYLHALRCTARRAQM
jgi:hypothetical protein